MSVTSRKDFNGPQLRTVTNDNDQASLGGGGPPDMTDRLERIEKRLDTIESEQRTHFRWMLGIFAVLGGLSLQTTNLLMGRIDRSEDKIARVETAISNVPGQVNQNLMQLTQTLAQTILAAQRTAPPPPPAPEPK